MQTFKYTAGQAKNTKRSRPKDETEPTDDDPHQPSPPQKQKGLPLQLFGDDNAPLKLIIVGHNPSETAWRQGHYYANPSNWLWRILKDTGIAPGHITGPVDDVHMPSTAGVGFTDVGSGQPGTDSSQFSSAHFQQWRQPFFDRLAQHAAQAAVKVGCPCGGRCGVSAPVVVAFSGKRQFAELFFSKQAGRKKQKASTNFLLLSSSEEVPASLNTTTATDQNTSTPHTVRVQGVRPSQISTGRQFVLPSGWPLPLQTTEVWVMTSTSGAAAMTREQRYAPWQALAERLNNVPWPRNVVKTCGIGQDGGGQAVNE